MGQLLVQLAKLMDCVCDVFVSVIFSLLIFGGITAVRDRFRAIFLTSLTTAVGLVPLLFETSTQAQLLLPIVASLAFGLTIATMSSLFVTPAMFMVLHDMGLIRRTKPGENEE